MSRRFAKFMLKAMGWTPVGGPAPDKKCIMLGVPHTSIKDFFVSYYYYRSVGGRINIMVKKEFDKWYLRWALKPLGVIFVDRSNTVGTLKSVIDAFNSRDELCLGLSPEGTRQRVKHWKMGFHTIARNAGVPVYLSFIDWKTKRVGIGERFEVTDDPKADLIYIQKYYKKMGVVGRHPEMFVFLDEVQNSAE